MKHREEVVLASEGSEGGRQILGQLRGEQWAGETQRGLKGGLASVPFFL